MAVPTIPFILLSMWMEVSCEALCARGQSGLRLNL